MALGVPYFSLPVSDQSELLVEDHNRWLHHQLAKEKHGHQGMVMDSKQHILTEYRNDVSESEDDTDEGNSQDDGVTVDYSQV